MYKALIYSDPHFCQYSSIVKKQGEKYSVRLHNLINSISWAEKLAEQKGCNSVICGGDFFNTSSLNAMEITALQDVYFSPKLEHIFLTGNHEANVASLDYSSANIFQSIGAKIISETECVEINDKVDLYYIPYITTNKTVYIRDHIKADSKKKIVISHNDIAGIQYGRFTSQSGFDYKEILDNVTLFINGHLHNGYVIDERIHLIGNLTGQNFNEDATKYEHLVYIMTINDDGTIELDPIVNPYAFNFYKLYINFRSDIAKLDTLKNNAVLSVSCNNAIIGEVEAKLKTLKNVAEYKLISTFDVFNEEGEEIDFKVEDHLKQFIDFVQTKIEPSPILSEEIILLGEN